MSSSQQRLAIVTAARLAAITDMEANLEAQSSELNRLRDQLRKAQLSARGSRRISHRNCKDGEWGGRTVPVAGRGSGPASRGEIPGDRRRQPWDHRNVDSLALGDLGRVSPAARRGWLGIGGRRWRPGRGPPRRTTGPKIGLAHREWELAEIIPIHCQHVKDTRLDSIVVLAGMQGVE